MFPGLLKRTMPRYQAVLIDRPPNWAPAGPDDVPPEPGPLGQVLAEADDLFTALRAAVAYNQAPSAEPAHWAVVVEPGSLGCTWRSARLCTPVRYQVVGIWWPVGWEPQSPLDVPNCVWRAQGTPAGENLDYPRAAAVARALNQQSLDHGAATWYVVLAVESEPLSQTVSYDAAGVETMVQVRRLHVVRPEVGSSSGDCSYCPAQSFECAKAEWTSLEQTDRLVRQRNLVQQD